MSEKLRCSYVLPLRWEDGAQRACLAGYLRDLGALCDEVLVVDGSRADVFEQNARAWGNDVTHVAPAPRFACPMGKVAGVNSGVVAAKHERVVVADDDVRFEPAALRRALSLLNRYDLVRPQNYFDPLPWHALWDTGRILLNRSLGSDFPGTLALRRSRLLAAGGYAGDVLFENLELIRTIEASGGRVVSAPGLYVRRLPPNASHFWGQRTRQAYDDFALPARMICWLSLIPSLLATAYAGRRRGIAGAALAAVLLGEHGRRRAGGARYFPARASLLAPAWLLERGVCAWLAVGQRMRFGGVRYRDSVIRTAAHSRRTLRRTAGRRSLDSLARRDWRSGGAHHRGATNETPPRAWAPLT